MGKIAASGYLQRLRELRGISRAYVAKIAGTSEQNIFRIEVEAQEPRAELLAAFTLAIEGDAIDVYELLVTKDATREDGEQRAEEWFQESELETKERAPISEEPGGQSQHATSRERHAKTKEVSELRRLVDHIVDRLQRLEEEY